MKLIMETIGWGCRQDQSTQGAYRGTVHAAGWKGNSK